MSFRNASSRGSRIEFLDATRGIAVLAVVVYHLYGGAIPAATTWLIEKENLGLFGVYSFFFVSGFIIPVSLQRSTVSQFWRSRFFRLIPVYWFSMALALLLGVVGLIQLTFASNGFQPRFIALNAVMLAPLFRKPIVLGSYWTLTIELCFYVICSGLKRSGLLTRRLLLAYLAIALYVVGLLAAIHKLFWPRLFRAEWISLLLAAFVGSVFYEVQQKNLKTKVLVPLTTLFLVVTYFGMRFDYAPGRHPVNQLHFSALYASWVEATIFFSVMFALREHQFPTVLLWLGRISYSLYLMHEIVNLLSKNLHHFSPMTVETLALAVSVIAADACYRFIERPALHYAKGRHRKDPTNPATPILSS